ncbi:hypothetical protein LSAT2_030834 [Lamellibrachia satsuma]|nr:hypothetical protein LSAT2_030834 [Lamellibrachia satsuma]
MTRQLGRWGSSNIIGANTNIALKKPAYQISHVYQQYASLAVDGNSAGVLATCSHTAKRLHDFTIGVTNTLATKTTGPEKLPHQVCLEYNGQFPTTSEMLNCTTIARGRYLFVQFREHAGYLSLCEVEVYSTVAIATGFTEFGDCAVFTDDKRNTCDVVTSSTNPLDFVLRMSLLQSQNSFTVNVILRDGDWGGGGGRAPFFFFFF